jgi:nitrite reductase/ring-hydroxylating ferredoxin subunit
MAEKQRLICASADLVERGTGVGFPLPQEGNAELTGFVVRYNGQVHAYVNRCAHVPVSLDWQEGDFFDLTRHYLICSTHGAQYMPESGHCVLGPCKGKSLQKLHTVERDGNVYLIESSNEESAS